MLAASLIALLPSLVSSIRHEHVKRFTAEISSSGHQSKAQRDFSASNAIAQVSDARDEITGQVSMSSSESGIGNFSLDEEHEYLRRKLVALRWAADLMHDAFHYTSKGGVEKNRSIDEVGRLCWKCKKVRSGVWRGRISSCGADGAYPLWRAQDMKTILDFKVRVRGEMRNFYYIMSRLYHYTKEVYGHLLNERYPQAREAAIGMFDYLLGYGALVNDGGFKALLQKLDMWEAKEVMLNTRELFRCAYADAIERGSYAWWSQLALPNLRNEPIRHAPKYIALALALDIEDDKAQELAATGQKSELFHHLAAALKEINPQQLSS